MVTCISYGGPNSPLSHIFMYNAHTKHKSQRYGYIPFDGVDSQISVIST